MKTDTNKPCQVIALCKVKGITTLEKPSAAATAEAKADSPAMSGSDNATPRSKKAYLECLDDTGAITRLEPLYDFAQQMELENRALREGCSKICASIGNGSACSPSCSVDFLTNALANEVKLYCAAQRAEIEYLRHQLKLARQLERELEALKQSILDLSHPNMKMLLDDKEQLCKQLAAERELRIMQLAGVSTASIQNTKTTIKDRIASDNPYYSTAYHDTCVAVDREMKLREQLAAKTEACENHFKIKQAAVVENVRLKSELAANERYLKDELNRKFVIQNKLELTQSNLTTLQKVAKELSLNVRHTEFCMQQDVCECGCIAAITTYNSQPKEVKGE